MTLPTFMPKTQADRQILGEFYDLYKDRQWFERAELYENHPKQMKKALEITVRYAPLLEMKEILTFIHKYNIGLETVSLSNQDNTPSHTQ